MNNHCSICGKLLSDPVSLARGIGPECILSQKSQSVNQGHLFTTRCSYTYEIRDGILMLIDLGGRKSLTNDMETVLREVEETEGELSEYKIIYCDSFGEWDGVIWNKGVVRFYSIGTTKRTHAIKLVDRKLSAFIRANG